MGNGSNTKSTQKQPKHHSFASQTQDSMRPAPDEYTGDSNVSRAGSGAYAAGQKSRKGGGSGGDVMPASGPKKQTY